jgi:drug/metabolite transporter (DMT)-like permease
MVTALPTRTKILPYVALILGVVALGFSALFVKWAAAPGPVMGFYRIGLAAVFMLPIFLYKARANRWALERRDLLFPLIGGLFTALDHAVWNTAVNYTTAANATLLGNTAPLWVALAAWLLFRERLVRLFWVGLALTLIGATIVLGSDFLTHPTLGLGDALALLAGIFYAGYFLVTQQGRKRWDTISYVWMVNLISSLFLLVMIFTLRMPITGYPPQTYLAFLGAALVSQVGGYLSVGYALGHLPASVVSPTMIGQPVVTALLAIPLLGELLSPAQWLGGLSVLLGIYLVHRSRQPAQSKEL